MDVLTPKERFNQLLSFLKDPEKNTYKRAGDKGFLPIWSGVFPILALDDLISLPENKLIKQRVMVNDCRQEAIEVMETDMFRNGLLRGNQKIPDIEIEHIEDFVLQMAAIVHIAKLKAAKSRKFLFYTFDGKLSVYDELRTAWGDLWEAFYKIASITLENELIRPDRLVGLNPKKRPAFEAQIEKLLADNKYEEAACIIKETAGGIRHKLVKMEAESHAKAHLKETKEIEEADFDAINELIRIFITNFRDFPTRPNYATQIDPLMAGHIWTLLVKYSGKKPRELPGDDAIRKRIPSIREQTFPHPQ